MKKLLFLSNGGKRITNFSIPSIYTGQSLGYDVHLAANYSEFIDDPAKYNVKIHHIDIARNPLNINNIKAYNQLLKLIKKEKFDVIHCNTPIGGVLGRLCGKQGKVPKVIYSAHGFHFYSGASLVNRTLFKWVEMWLAHYTDAILTINQEDYQAAQDFKLRNNGNVYYIPGVGVDTLQITEAESKRQELLKEIGANINSVLIISIGELNKNKNNKVIIEALGKLQKSNIHYLLCGVGDKKGELISLSRKYKIDENVHLLGYRNDIPQLLKSCDIFVMPSYREGLSRSLMEAMSAGLPCVVSKIRGNVDLIEEDKGGYLCQPEDVDSFAEVINNLAMDHKKRRNMSEYNINKIRQFDVKNVKIEMKKIYNKELL